VLFEAGIIVNRMEEAELERPERQAAIAQAVGEAVDLFCAEEGGRRR
jgi:N-acetylmuramoyl-L-alanine amidase